MDSLSDPDLSLSDEEIPGWDFDDDFMYEDDPEVLPRCGLCRFKFDVGEEVMICHPTFGRPPFVAQYYPPFTEESTAGDDGMEPERGYHPDCVKLASPDLMIKGSLDPNIFNVTGYGTDVAEPLPSFEARRVRWLRQSFSLNLKRTLFDRLPLEICENIASYCLRERAVQVIRDLWMQPGRSEPRNFKLGFGDKGLYWVQYVEIEGLKYVKSFSSRRQSEHDTKLFMAKPDTGFNIYFAEDNLGIRGIIITRKDEPPPVTRSYSEVRWVVHRHQKAPFWFRIKSDGIKLRRLAITDTADAKVDFLQRRWTMVPERFDSFPQLPPTSNDPDIIEEAPDYTVYAADWNPLGAYGYSFNVYGDSVQRMIVHQPGKPNSSHMDAYVQDNGLWVYMPVDPGERISELWIRKQVARCGNGWSHETETLILCTNNGRSLVLGTHLGTMWENDHKADTTYRAIAALPSMAPSRMFYTGIPYAKSWLGFEQASTWEGREVQLPSRWSSDVTDSHVYTSVELDGVVAVSPCRSWLEARDNFITGLLFTYLDGRQRCTGQVRLDRLEASIPVSSETLWLGCTSNPWSFAEMGVWPPYQKNIDWVGFSEPLQDGKREYLAVPLRGRLEWGFCYNACSVSHNESSEPQDEMLEVMSQEAASGKVRPDPVAKAFSVLTGGVDD